MALRVARLVRLTEVQAGAVGMALDAQGADMVLVVNDLRRVPTAIRLSRRCRSTLSVNVAGPLP